MKKTTLFLNITTLVALILFSACSKNDDNSIDDNSVKLIKNEVIADSYWNAVDADVRFAENFIGSNNFKYATDSCPTINVEYIDSLNYQITIDFGDEYCETWHGKLKKGKIIIQITDFTSLTGATSIVTLEDFYIDDHHIEGTKTTTNNGYNDDDNLNYTISLEGGKITFPDGSIITRTSNHNHEWISESGWQNWWNYEWLIRGTANGTSKNGVTYSTEITNPILIKSACKYPVSGTVKINISDTGLFVLDYGNGECDNEATVYHNNETWTITLD